MDSKAIYFWRESDNKTGWLSQWYYCPFTDDEDPNIIYDTAEHYMMYHKAMLFNDSDVAAQVLTAKHPRQVKALGRAVSNFDEQIWEENRDSIVLQGNILKFTRAVTEEGFRLATTSKPDGVPFIRGSLKEMLVETGDRELVEASPYDRIWGVGFKPEDAAANRPSWGLNLLGKALMSVREQLRNSTN
ncbi:hypothetical protein Golomagni_07242 [Golovinomyces magnicellulatus]|nr:hypothetical protein Golomagni_07242 [Golovinomyces magnicellulatus]